MKKHTGYKVNHHTTNHKKYRKLSKTAAIVGSTVTAVSVAAPLMPAVNVQADTVQYSSASSQQQFINQIAPHAQSVANANDLYASVMMAQAILESAWGQSTLAQAPNYNLFGIKGSYNGQTVYMNTLEFLNGQWVTKNEPFRRYPSFAESFMDNARTLRNVSFQSGVYYYAGAWKSNTTSYRDATAWLTGRYATDPNYATSLNRIIETYGLTRYDTASNGTPSTVIGGGISSENNAGVVNNPSQSTGNLGGSTYTVSVGDTLWAISRKFGVTITQLKSWNNLSSDMIYVGQKLSIQTGTGNTAVTPTPSTPVVPNNPTTSNAQTYTVVAGDSVWKIAHQFGISMDTLRSLNNIQNNFIYPGQVLKIQASNTVTPSTPSSNQTTTTTTGSYTVKAGDSLWKIANQHGLSLSQLKSINHLSSDLIYPGQKLVVKSGATSTSITTSSQSTVTNQVTNQTTTPVSRPSANTQASYTVKAGDSLWAIATKHGLSVSQLKSLNQLSSDMIYPGQKLTVKGGNTASVSTSTVTTTTVKPAPTQVSNQTVTATDKTYKVVSGDSVWKIAHQFGISMDTLRSLNHIKNDFIYPGQVLKVQASTTTTTSASQGASSVATTSSDAATYRVKSGDSLWSIAKKHGLSLDQLKALNHLTSDLIFVNQTLKVK
ncbi:LysM peptidoglycan-binding domain-containing protein [Enterococcus cecorum]|uniref:LysM peptidoglycan-binding domain-containing protein n=1 Tax=Enterococcus cecorum TaxID=44008 RepID=UPI0022D1E8FF|nr:LysM peptidoglycan-binding domain-containing protein [Enterococcus cecorum]CAI3265936.1 LysM peptidoglycan-binding domain-containing protein [Enterococcus cecorum]CAI3429951.1 LysM peptidoglycan-binding domain-containing protein [Enterococcus cecorum]CAI3439586.1 LysM peptidoglycan-binding domain-containing protein [Enterococcus cecorum]CAI3443375.1 LysM peptidoglycan-binding domain-containing protein [Enterococcus cecorum]CAI3444658.1 LysM peptidoglycan-binding domain-containing protein [E